MLFKIEIASIGIFLLLIGLLLFQDQEKEQMRPLSLDALNSSSSHERWNGIFFHDQQVGYSVSRTNLSEDGTMLMEQRSLMKIATFGQAQQILTASAALTDSDGLLRRFDFFMKSDMASLSVRGQVKDHQIVMEIDQGNGEVQELDFPIDNPPQVSLSLESIIRRTPLSMGLKFSVPYFDPVSMSEGKMDIRVVDTEILVNGEEAWWLQSSFNGIETRSLVTTTGDILRQEGALGIAMMRMTAEEAQELDTEMVDLIALSAVPFKGGINNPRSLTELTMIVHGVEMDRIPHEPPLQSVMGSTVSIVLPLLSEIPTVPIASSDHSEFLQSSLTISANEPLIIERAEQLIEGQNDRLSAVKAINEFVFDFMEKVPVIGVPNGLSALKDARGDCNEHSALFISLARSVGIPTRIAAGVVYSDRSGPIGQFYYHAWPEVLLGDGLWIPVDPTFGQVPADATHLKLVEGDLERQLEIMSFLGQLQLEGVEL